MASSFEYGYGPRGYAIDIDGQVAEDDARGLIAFLHGFAWRPARSPEARRSVVFLVPAGSERAWMGTVWDAGADSFGRLGTVGAKGRLLEREDALDRMATPDLVVEIQRAVERGISVVVAASDQVVVPRVAVVLQGSLRL